MTKFIWMAVCFLSTESWTVAQSDGSEYLRGQVFMDVAKAEKRWGSASADVSKFASGSLAERARMASSFVRSKSMNGKNSQEVRQVLGPFTGHFWSTQVPAYILEEGWRKNQDTWQLVFLLDDSGKIKEARIHRNCCPK